MHEPSEKKMWLNSKSSPTKPSGGDFNSTRSNREHPLKWLHAKAGYTILEMGIASMILAFVFASTIAVAGRCFRYTTDMRRASQSWQIAQQKVEDLRLMSWAQLQALATTSSFTDPNDSSNLFQGRIGKLTLESYAGAPTLMLATVSVIYTNRANGVVTNSLSTYFSNGGLNRYIM
jgi:type II secretory pathway pseudopilin PulG